MISGNYVSNLIRSHGVLLGASFVFVALFQVLVMMLIQTIDIPAMLQGMVQQMPPPVQGLFGEQYVAQFSLSGAIGFGYNHPLVLVTLSLVAITLPARHIAGEVEDGTLELLLAMPIPRYRVACSLWLGSALAVFVLVIGCWFGTSIGLIVFPEARAFEWTAVLRLGLNLGLLMVAVSSYTLLMSAFAREGGKAALRAAGVTLFFFFLDVTIQIWSAIDFLAPVTLFHYYQPQEVVRGEPGWGWDIAILAFVILLTGALAVSRVHRRDIP